MNSNKSFSSETSERYAKAMLEIAQENKELTSVEKGISELSEIYNSNSEFKNFIKNPTHSLENQIEVINKISELMNFPKILKNFLSVLVMKRRIFFLKKIIISFLKLASTKRGVLNASLTSSKDLSKDELDNISKELSKSVGSSISFKYKVDNNLIGGLKIQIGSLMIDTSIKNKLKKYEQLMLER